LDSISPGMVSQVPGKAAASQIAFNAADGAENASSLATTPGRGFFAILRPYGPERAAIDYSWKPGDFVKANQ
jgi:hypothetical protein